MKAYVLTFYWGAQSQRRGREEKGGMRRGTQDTRGNGPWPLGVDILSEETRG